jgi:regulator of CtrA degradation
LNRSFAKALLASAGAADYAGFMPLMPSIHPRIVEALYSEALVLADVLRERFERLRNDASATEDELLRVQFSCEALRTTTRVMHCLAWLLNHRAYFAGELSELQLRRHGRLIANYPASDPAALDMLPADARLLVHESERLYERITRLERAWRSEDGRNGGGQNVSVIDRLRERLDERFAGNRRLTPARRLRHRPAIPIAWG